MRYFKIKAQYKATDKPQGYSRVSALKNIELPSWVALLGVMLLALLLSGCFSARQQYGYDQNAVHMVAAKAKLTKQPLADPITTSALPAGQQTGWAPHFYPGSGVSPGQNDVQSQPFTPRGIQSTAGMPPKPSVSPVDLPAPPLPLPESTAAPSTTLFGRNTIGRQVGFAARGLNFGGTALGGAPKFHQPAYQNSLKVFPNNTPAPQPGFRVANNNLRAAPLPYPQLGAQQAAPVPQYVPQNAPAPMKQQPAPMMSPNSQPKMQVFNNPVQPQRRQQVVQPRVTQQNTPPQIQVMPQGQLQPSAPHFNMANNMGGYAPRPVPKGSNLVVTGNGYLVDTGDELNIRVLGQKDLTGRYQVDSTGAITMPMISTVAVRGRTVSQISNLIQARLRQGFLRTPSVSVEVITARPFFILGQIKKPGKYNFVNGLTVSQAIAIAGGYEPRARKGVVRVTRQTPQGPISAEVPNEEPLMPGDTIYVKQRWF